MKVIAINGSPRKDGNTAMLMDTVLAELKKKGLRQNRSSLAARRFMAAQHA
jgi:multimeric flavodoxin WrbA